jgi:hypothetical protein
MATHHPTTFGALPFLLLLLQKWLYANILDVFEVLNHAHLEICSVAVIKML